MGASGRGALAAGHGYRRASACRGAWYVGDRDDQSRACRQDLCGLRKLDRRTACGREWRQTAAQVSAGCENTREYRGEGVAGALAQRGGAARRQRSRHGAGIRGDQCAPGSSGRGGACGAQRSTESWVLVRGSTRAPTRRPAWWRPAADANRGCPKNGGQRCWKCRTRCLQWRHGQCRRSRFADRDCAMVSRYRDASEALADFLGGDGRGKRRAGIGVFLRASDGRARQDCRRPEHGHVFAAVSAETFAGAGPRGIYAG